MSKLRRYVGENPSTLHQRSLVELVSHLATHCSDLSLIAPAYIGDHAVTFTASLQHVLDSLCDIAEMRLGREVEKVVNDLTVSIHADEPTISFVEINGSEFTTS